MGHPASILFKVINVERQYINEAEALTTVSFQLPSSCWSQLQKSLEWNQFQSKLQEIQSRYRRAKEVVRGMGIIIAVAVVWAAAGIGCYIMKKIQPENKLYLWYAIAVCVIFTAFVVTHVS